MKARIKSVVLLLLLATIVLVMCSCGTGEPNKDDGSIDGAGVPETEITAEVLTPEDWDALILETLQTGENGYDPYDYDLSEIQAQAEKGDADSQSLMGDIIYFSEQSREAGMAARQWYEMAAGQEDAWAQYMMGYTMEGVPADNQEEVMAYLQQAADQGLICACYELGQIYYNGQVQGKLITQDVIKAKELFERAVNGEHLYSQEYRKWIDQMNITMAKIYLGY